VHGKRKLDQLRISLEEDVSFKGVTTGFEEYRFIHQALPEVDRSEIDLSVTLFGKRLEIPLLISSMTGGTEPAQRINRNLAMAAERLGAAMGVGSQRAAIDDASLAYTYQVRDVAPNVLLFANLGAVQLNYGYDIEDCRRAVEMIQADGLILHLNPLQEALQPEGNTNFAGLLTKIERVCRSLSLPIMVKEVGWGISGKVARRLVEARVAGIDVAGAGGTSWSEVEKHRVPSQAGKDIVKSFAQWGIPTAESIRMVRQAAPEVVVIASGGIRTGIDAAKAIALGADAVALAAPFLEPATVSAEDVIEVAKGITEELRTAMFCIGAANLVQLKGTNLLERIRKI